MKHRQILQQPLLQKYFGIVVDVSYSNDNSPVMAFPVFYTVCLGESLFCSLFAFPRICSLSLFPVPQQFALSPRALSFSWGRNLCPQSSKRPSYLKGTTSCEGQLGRARVDRQEGKNMPPSGIVSAHMKRVYLESESQVTKEIKWQCPFRVKRNLRQVGTCVWKQFWQRPISPLSAHTHIKICIFFST